MNALMLLTAAAGIGATVALAVAGVFRVRNTDDKMDISIDKKKLKRKVRKAADRTRKAGRKAVETAREAFAKAKSHLGDGPQGRPRASASRESAHREAAAGRHNGRS